MRYSVRLGCGWRMLPIHFGHWRKVYGWLRELARGLVPDHPRRSADAGSRVSRTRSEPLGGGAGEGFKLIGSGLEKSGSGWVFAFLAVGAALTGGAILRATGRIFLGLGPESGEEEGAPTEEECEKADRPFWLMTAPAALLTLLAFLPGDLVRHYAETAIQPFFHPDNGATLGLQPPRAALEWMIWVAVAGSLVIAG